MNILFKKHVQILKELIAAGVDFLIVGGYAVNFHGYNRVTGDLDVWIKPDNQIRDILIGLFEKMAFDTSGLDSLRSADFTKPFVFHIWEEPFKVDFLTIIAGNSFQEAYENRVLKEIEGIPIPFIGLNDLVASKMTTNRLRDQADVEELQKVQKFQEKS